MTGGTDALLMLQALRAFLREDVQPELDGFKAYSNRVAANMLGILEREMAQGSALARLDADFRAAGGLSGRDLALALRDGAVNADRELVAYLRRRVLAQLAIDNPRYPGYLEARDRWNEGPQE